MSLHKSYEVDMPGEKVFATRDELMDWVKAVGKQLGFVIIIRRSYCGSKGRGSKSRQLAILGCELGGKYKPYKPKLKRKGTRTKKCDCPFRLKAGRTSEDGLWRLTVVRGDHNHKPAKNLLGHAYVSRLTSEEKEMVGKMVDNKVKPAHTRPTNIRYRFLEMVGMTSVGFTCTIGFGYMCNEREPEVTWALQKLRGLILREEDMPKVMVTYRDTSLMNAVEATFPTTTHLLCQFHIAKCVKAKCKLTIKPKEMWDDVGDAWNKVMYS
ncbi:uncharacterized protein LOC130712810 [Lotus japonicus]|uniref:uncharacterized protein LOC130712810 n=1 Tax=Lotus japonicus TaxID=34305 RepID=UPI0025838186|nr:uncharacterized protein LOC130712810 [Lotus japonicus]